MNLLETTTYHYILKKCKKFNEIQSNKRLIKSYMEKCSAFGLTQLIDMPTRSTLNTLSLVDQLDFTFALGKYNV